MSYVINRYNGEELVVLTDGTLDTTTSLGLVGRNYVGYGTQQNENFLYLLENFANDAPPARPISGQTWFNTSNNSLNVYDGVKWHPVSTEVSDTDPPNPTAGSIWLKTPVNQLYLYDGASWTFIGPEAVEGFGITRPRATSLIDSTQRERPVILLTINGTVVAIASEVAFTIDPSNGIAGFSNLVAGITLSTSMLIKGDLTGLASRATQLEYARTINGVQFNGTQDITITASTTGRLIKGNYLVGTNFNGSTDLTWAVDATPNAVIGKVVARNSAGGFAATSITSDLVGNVTGNVTGTTGTFSIVEASEFRGATLTGNAFSASRLQTARFINGVSFDGTENVTVPAAANTLTTTSLAANVTSSNLRQLGYLDSLSVQGAGGVGVGNGTTDALRISISGSTARIKGTSGFDLSLDDLSVPAGVASIKLLTADQALTAGGESVTTAMPELDLQWNLGIPSKRFNKLYSKDMYGDLKGNATTSTSSITATNLAGGGVGSVAYQTTSGTTSMLPAGTPGYTLATGGSGAPYWTPNFQSAYFGTTQVSFNRTSGALTLNDVSITGNAATVTNGVYTTGAYVNPSWISSLSWNKITDISLATVARTGSYTDLINKPISANAQLQNIVQTVIGTIDLYTTASAGSGYTAGYPSISGTVQSWSSFTSAPVGNTTRTGVSMWSGNNAGPTVTLTVDLAAFMGLTNNPTDLNWKGNYDFNVAPSLTRVTDLRNTYYSMGYGNWAVYSEPATTSTTSSLYGKYYITISVTDTHPYHGTNVQAGWLGIGSRGRNVYNP